MGKLNTNLRKDGAAPEQAMVVKDNHASANSMEWKFIDEVKCQGGSLRAIVAGWIIVETANIKAEDGIEKYQTVKLKLRLGASYVYEAEFMIDDIKGFDIVPGTKWLCNINRR